MVSSKFFYPNPLSSDGEYCFNADRTKTRQPWFGCACCPSNLCRFIPSMPGYIYGVRGNSLYVNLFAANTATIQMGGRDVTLEQTTQYPWDGDISLRVASNKAGLFTMKVRIPGWVRNQTVPTDLYNYADAQQPSYSITINGQCIEKDGKQPQPGSDGYVSMTRRWKKGDIVRIHFDMPVRTVEANKRVADDRGRVAIERGPLVYCAEWADNKGINPHHLLISQPQFEVQPTYTIQNTESATDNAKTFNVTAITAKAQEASITPEGRLATKDVTVRLIPYYAWNHRGAGRMDVWLARSLSGLED